MKKVIFLISFLAIVGGIFQVSKAQAVCNLCQTQVNTINQFDFGTGGGFKSIGFQASFSGSPFCQVLGLEWNTSEASAQITQDGSWARVDFPLLGPVQHGGSLGNIVQVCCTYSQWRDMNQNGITEPWEICKNTLCVTVNL